MPLLLADIEDLDKVGISPIKKDKHGENRDYELAYVLSLALQGRGCSRAYLALQRLTEHPKKYIRVGACLGLSYLGIVPVPEIDVLLDVINEGHFKYIPLRMYQLILRSLEPVFKNDIRLRDVLSQQFYRIYQDKSLHNLETAMFLTRVGVLSEPVVNTLLYFSEGSHYKADGSEFSESNLAERSRNALADFTRQHSITDLPDDLSVRIIAELGHLKLVPLDIQAIVLSLLQPQIAVKKPELCRKAFKCVMEWKYADENTYKALEEAMNTKDISVVKDSSLVFQALFPDRIKVPVSFDVP
jgi:hypothetical protein